MRGSSDTQRVMPDTGRHRVGYDNGGSGWTSASDQARIIGEDIAGSLATWPAAGLSGG